MLIQSRVFFFAPLLCAISLPSWAETLADCAGIEADPVRLACYDRIAKEALPDKQVFIVDAQPGTPPALPVVVPVAPPASPVTALSERWELDEESKAGTFKIRAHHPTFILPLFATNSVNRSPSSPAPGHSAVNEGEQRSGEVKFQISFKTKLAETMFGGPSDLWFGYTQQSHWQLYNEVTSRNFRETDYAPELILTTPVDVDVLDGKWRMINLGLLHQSNGRDLPLSRSWNRVYAQFGFERGKWSLMVRPWWRIPEDEGNDDNPDISKYMGHGDLTATWKYKDYVASMMFRKSFSDGGKGAVQADWAFPISRHLKGHVQVFSGYGESLIDYNFKQTTFGLGVSLSEGM